VQATSVGKKIITATIVIVPTSPRPSARTMSGAVVTMGIDLSAIATGSATPATTGQSMKIAASAAPRSRPAR